MDTGRQGKCELVLRCFSAAWLAAIPPTLQLWVPRQEPGVRRGSTAAEGFWSWLIHPANVTAILGCRPPGPFLPFLLFFTSTGEMSGGRYVLGSCLL